MKRYIKEMASAVIYEINKETHVPYASLDDVEGGVRTAIRLHQVGLATEFETVKAIVNMWDELKEYQRKAYAK